MKNIGRGGASALQKSGGAMVRRRSAVLCGRREPCFKGNLREPSPRTLRWLDYRKSVGGGLALAQRNSQPLLAHIGPNNRSGHIAGKARCKDSVKIDENANATEFALHWRGAYASGSGST